MYLGWGFWVLGLLIPDVAEFTSVPMHAAQELLRSAESELNGHKDYALAQAHGPLNFHGQGKVWAI